MEVRGVSQDGGIEALVPREASDDKRAGGVAMSARRIGVSRPVEKGSSTTTAANRAAKLVASVARHIVSQRRHSPSSSPSELKVDEVMSFLSELKQYRRADHAERRRNDESGPIVQPFA